MENNAMTISKQLGKFQKYNNLLQRTTNPSKKSTYLAKISHYTKMLERNGFSSSKISQLGGVLDDEIKQMLANLRQEASTIGQPDEYVRVIQEKDELINHYAQLTEQLRNAYSSLQDRLTGMTREKERLEQRLTDTEGTTSEEISKLRDENRELGEDIELLKQRLQELGSVLTGRKTVLGEQLEKLQRETAEVKKQTMEKIRKEKEFLDDRQRQEAPVSPPVSPQVSPAGLFP